MNELLTTEDINHLNAQNAALRVENARLQLLVDEARTLSPEAFMALEAERDALREALLFYADGIRPLLDAQTNTYQYIAPDDGHIARDALAEEGDDA